MSIADWISDLRDDRDNWGSDSPQFAATLQQALNWANDISSDTLDDLVVEVTETFESDIAEVEPFQYDGITISSVLHDTTVQYRDLENNFKFVHVSVYARLVADEEIRSCPTCGYHCVNTDFKPIISFSASRGRIEGPSKSVCPHCWRENGRTDFCSDTEVLDNHIRFDVHSSAVTTREGEWFFQTLNQCSLNRALEALRAQNASPQTGQISWTAMPDPMSWPDEPAPPRRGKKLKTIKEHLDSGLTCPVNVLAYSSSPLAEYGNVFLHGSREKPPANNRFFGVELEVEWGDTSDEHNAVKNIAQAIGPFGLLTHDGSLRSGFEIKTLPATFKAHQEIWARFFEHKPHKYVKSWHGGRCGMHIHVSSESITPLVLGKLNVFFNRALHWDFINTIAGRTIQDNHYCYPVAGGDRLVTAFHSRNVLNKYIRQYKKRYEGNGARIDVEHHNAFVSYEMHGKPTYECRIFRGNLSPAGFLKNMEFFDSLIAWCEDTSAVNINIESYKAWLFEPHHAAQYRNLLAFLENRKIFQKVRGTTIYFDEQMEAQV